MALFNYNYDPTKKIKGNVFDAVAAVGRLCAEGITTLQQVKEALNGTNGSGVGRSDNNIASMLLNLSSSGGEIQVLLRNLVRGIESIGKSIETIGQETLTSEVAMRLREEIARQDGTIEALKKMLETKSAGEAVP